MAIPYRLNVSDIAQYYAKWLKFWQQEYFTDGGDSRLTKLLEDFHRTTQISNTTL